MARPIDNAIACRISTFNAHLPNLSPQMMQPGLMGIQTLDLSQREACQSLFGSLAIVSMWRVVPTL